VVKKGLASGTLDAPKAIEFVLGNAAVTSLVIGGLDIEHIRENVRAIESL
jgi:aryl-alcohol dehydrogenase-like predicted oxidoreductase